MHQVLPSIRTGVPPHVAPFGFTCGVLPGLLGWLGFTHLMAPLPICLFPAFPPHSFVLYANIMGGCASRPRLSPAVPHSVFMWCSPAHVAHNNPVFFSYLPLSETCRPHSHVEVSCPHIPHYAHSAELHVFSQIDLGTGLEKYTRHSLFLPVLRPSTFSEITSKALHFWYGDICMRFSMLAVSLRRQR